MDELKEIKAVEVFSSGKWNGDTYTDDDLDCMVETFNEYRSTCRPPLKLGHDEGQKILQKDGYPAAGWISNLYRVGNKLIADFVDIPSKVAELIKRKAYRNVSSEIYWNIDINGKKHRRMLSAVSLLGGDMPAVANLDDMLALYGASGSVKIADRVGVYANADQKNIIRKYQFDAPREALMEKTEREIQLEKDIEAKSEKLKKFEMDFEGKESAIKSLEDENAELKKFKADAEERALKAEQDAMELAIEKEILEMEKEKTFSPAMKPYVKALIGPEKKEYSFGDAKLSKSGMVKELLKLHSAACGVNLEEQTVSGDKEKSSGNTEADLHDKIAKFADDNKVSYSAAYKAVMKTVQKG
jgi:hypothetical protein